MTNTGLHGTFLSISVSSAEWDKTIRAMTEIKRKATEYGVFR